MHIHRICVAPLILGLVSLISSLAEESPSAEFTADGRRYLEIAKAVAPSFNWDLKLTNARAADTVDLVFGHGDGPSYCRFQWKGKRGELRTCSGGRESVLVAADLPEVKSLQELEISIRRRHAVLRVVVDGRICLEGTDGSFQGGRCGMALEDKRLDVLESRVQPMEDLRFSDEFMREANQEGLGHWAAVAGNWTYRSVMEEVRHNRVANIRKGREPEPERSANPFCFVATPGKGSLATTGFRFWDDYDYGVSLKTRVGECGLVFHYRSPQDYFTFRWDLVSFRRLPCKARLTKVSPDGEQVLAERFVLGRAEQWYRLSVTTSGRRILASIDRVRIFDVFDDRATGGQVGLLASSEEDVFFDDVSVHTSRQVELDRKEVIERRGAALLGKWETHQRAPREAGHPVPPVRLEATSSAASVHALTTPPWEPYYARCQVRVPGPTGMAGIVFGLRDSRNYLCIRERPDGERTRCELVSVKDGKPEVLHAVEGGPRETQWSEYAVDLTDPGTFLFQRNGRLSMRCRLASVPSGQFGVYAEGAAGTEFQSAALLRECPRDWEQLEDNKIFSGDPYMQEWASPKWAWIPSILESSPPPTFSEVTKPREEMDYPTLAVKADTPNAPVIQPEVKRREFLHKGDFFGSYSIRVPLTDALTLAFADEDPNEERGYAVSVAIRSARKDAEAAAPMGTAATPGPGTAPAGKDAAPDAAEEKDDVDTTIQKEREDAARKALPPPAPDDREYDVRLSRHGKEIETVRIHEPEDIRTELTIHRDGNYVSVYQASTPKADSPEASTSPGDARPFRPAGRPVIEYRDTTPLNGRRVRIITMLPVDLSTVPVQRDHVKDYLFKQAPVDWTRKGEWEVTNRFSCDPRWSHLNGRSTSAAILWHKDRFPGDVTLEFYAGMRMRQGLQNEDKLLAYPRVGDLNATIAAVGEEVASGYSFVLGAWDPGWSETWTRILRKNLPVSQTDQQLLPRTRVSRDSVRLVRVGSDPGGRAIHGAWYYIKIRRIGNSLKYYFDNHLALSFPDDQPLPGDRLGIWTYNNSIMVARVKISYDTYQPALDALDPEAMDENSGEAMASRQSPLRISLPSHPGVSCSFDEEAAGWKAPHGDESASISLDTRVKAAGAASLRMTNALPGGDLGVRVPIPPMNILQADQISFDYRIPPDVKINLYFSVKDDPLHRKFCFIRLTGEDRSSAIVTRIDGAPEAIGDGEWHRYSFALGAALRDLWPGQRELFLDVAQFGNFHEGYLNVGFGGNGGGAAYHIDNFAFSSRGGPAFRMAWEPASGLQPESFAVSVDRSPMTDPRKGKTLPGTAREFQMNVPSSGRWIASLSARRPDGSWSPVQSVPFFVDAAAPAVVSLLPAHGAAWGGGPITLTLAPDTDIHTEDVQVQIAGKDVPREALDLHVQPEKRTLTLGLNRLGQTFQEGQEVRLAIRTTGAAGTQGLHHEWAYSYRLASDKEPPAHVRLLDQPARFDFECPETRFHSYSTEAAATIDSTTAARGRSCLKLTCMFAGSPFTVPLPIPPFHAGQFSLLSFDYRVARLVRSNLVLQLQGQEEDYDIVFTDSGSHSAIGGIPGIEPDDRWHHAEVNLRSILLRAGENQNPDILKVAAMKMQDLGYQGNAPGATIRLDNVELVPMVSSRLGFPLRWTSSDLSGVRGYSYSWSDGQPEDAPTTVRITTQQHVFRDAPDGEQVYLNLRAVDQAGNWGETSHFRFRIDNIAPTFESTFPQPGAESSIPFVRVRIPPDISGVDISSLRINLDGKSYPYDHLNAVFSEETGELMWHWAYARGPLTGPVPDKQNVTLRLERLSDFAGNESTPLEWSWQIRHEKDNSPPLAPVVKTASATLHLYEDFSSPSAQFEPFQSTSSAVIVHEPGKMDRCLRITGSHAGGAYGAVVVTRPFDVTRFPIFSVEYRLRKNSRVHLWLKVRGAWQTIAKGTEFIGDEKWHVTWFDLSKLLKRHSTDSKDTTIEAVAITDTYAVLLGDYYDYTAPQFWLDGVAVLARDGAAQASFDCATTDETGVQNYSYALDQNYDHVADVKEMAGNVDVTLSEKQTREAEETEGTEAKVNFGFERYQATIPDDRPEGLFARRKFGPLPKAGMWYLHIRAQDGAGNWGGTAHFPYYCGKAVEGAELEETFQEE